MPTLFLRLTGLCAFVPNLTADQMRVILVDASVPHGRHGKAHSPRLIFRQSAWTPVPGLNPELFTDPCKEPMAMLDLSDQEVFIDGAGGHALAIEGWGSAVGECPKPDGSDRFAFSWVGPMQPINEDSGLPNLDWGSIKDHFLDSSNVPSEVAARVSLTEGHVTNHEFSRDDLRRIVKWMFKNATGQAHIKQALSEEVQLSYGLNAAATFVELGFITGIHSSTPSASGPKLRLNVSNGRADAWVANMPLDEIRNRCYHSTPIPKPHPTGVRDPDHHFVHFYDLVKGGPKNRVPHPAGRCNEPILPPSVDNPKCPPVQLNPASGA